MFLIYHHMTIPVPNYNDSSVTTTKWQIKYKSHVITILFYSQLNIWLSWQISWDLSHSQDKLHIVDNWNWWHPTMHVKAYFTGAYLTITFGYTGYLCRHRERSRLTLSCNYRMQH